MKFLVTVLAFSLTGCASVMVERISKLPRGTTKQQVLEKFGEPDSSFDNSWVYTSGCTACRVDFESYSVTGTQCRESRSCQEEQSRASMAALSQYYDSQQQYHQRQQQYWQQQIAQPQRPVEAPAAVLPQCGPLSIRPLPSQPGCAMSCINGQWAEICR